MKRASRTTITWRFENPMAPNGKHYMPLQCWGLSLVSVVVTIFRGKIKFKVWLTSSRRSSDGLKDFVRHYFFGSPGSREWTESLGLTPEVDEDGFNNAIFVNGDAASVNFVFHAKNGESVTRTACLTFIAFCEAFGDLEYRKSFFLPTPEIVQETMVEAHCKDNWITYGQFMWEQDFAHIADAAANANTPVQK